MGAETHKSCPDCGTLDFISEGSSLVLDASGDTTGTLTCVNCSWTGRAADTIILATTERVFGVEEISGILVRIVAKHAAGPLIQALEFTGVSPSPSTTSLSGWAELVEDVRSEVLRDTISAALEAAFMAGSKGHHTAAEMLWARHPQQAAQLYPNNKPEKVPAKEKKAQRKAEARGRDARVAAVTEVVETLFETTKTFAPSHEREHAAQRVVDVLAAARSAAVRDLRDEGDEHVTAAEELMGFFAYGHLPPALQAVSKEYGEAAEVFQSQLADTPLKVRALRLLLEAKDSAVRASLRKAEA